MAISLIDDSIFPFLREETVHSGPDREGGVHRGDRVREARERTRGKSQSKIYTGCGFYRIIVNNKKIVRMNIF